MVKTISLLCLVIAMFLATNAYPKNLSESTAFDSRQSLIDWKRLSPERWLDFKTWKKNLYLKEADVKWREKLSDALTVETAGIVLQCLNKCTSYTGEGSAQAFYGSRLEEGSQYVTGQDSAAWVMLRDGSLLRLSADTSVTFLEVNRLADRVFHLLRLNYGHVYIESRQQRILEKKQEQDLEQEQLSYRADTDLGMYPLLEIRANRENYLERTDLQARFAGVKKQGETLNEMLAQANGPADFRSEWFVFTANANLKAYNFSGHLFYEPLAGLAIYHQSSDQAGARLHLRSEHETPRQIDPQNWYRVNAEGSELARQDLKGGEAALYFVKRIQTVRLASELLFKRHFEDSNSRIWKEDEFTERMGFLNQWVQESELAQLKRLKQRAAAKDFSSATDELVFEGKYYEESLRRSGLALKSIPFYTQEVVSMNRTQYYLWILEHAKNFLPSYLSERLTSSQRDP